MRIFFGKCSAEALSKSLRNIYIKFFNNDGLVLSLFSILLNEWALVRVHLELTISNIFNLMETFYYRINIKVKIVNFALSSSLIRY